MINFLKNNKYLFLIVSLLIPIVIYFYFLEWRTAVIYGDDLYIYIYHSNLSGFYNKINLSLIADKYRPVHDLTTHILIELFHKNIFDYYLFNVVIQTTNTFLFVAILNLFLRSIYLSLFFSLLVGLSRFAFYSMTQLMNGGTLEGLGMSFFFLCLYFILKVVADPNSNSFQKQKGIILGIMFANLSMYTHERYIVLFPFIFLVVFFAPVLKSISKNQKIVFSFFILFSIVLNVVIKKSIYSMPFFVGGGGTNISFSFLSALGYFKDAFLTLLEINSGPDYLVGMGFLQLPYFVLITNLLLTSAILLILFSYTRKIILLKLKGNDADSFIFLLFLFGLTLVPAIVTIRVEQRWLQASFSILILMIVIAINKIEFKTLRLKHFTLSLFIIVFLGVDMTYLYLGAKNVYISSSEKVVMDFKKAIDDGIVHPTSVNFYIWQKTIDQNSISAINWDLAGGDFFTFYQNKGKKLIFVDSIYEKLHAGITTEISNFNIKTDQIIFLGNSIVDTTNNHFKDFLEKLDSIPKKNESHDSARLLEIDNKSLNKFLIRGFYNYEKGIAWTNGDATILLNHIITSSDSLQINLNTYMPLICENVHPKLFLKDGNGEVYQATSTKRTADLFVFKFYFKKATYISSINILSETIDASPDKRILSFPFISLKISH